MNKNLGSGVVVHIKNSQEFDSYRFKPRTYNKAENLFRGTGQYVVIEYQNSDIQGGWPTIEVLTWTEWSDLMFQELEQLKSVAAKMGWRLQYSVQNF